MNERRYAGVIAIYDGRIVLVRERRDHWGGAFWNIPSGTVESHETPALAAVRELAEETGLAVRPDDLQLVGTSSTQGMEHRSLAWNFTTLIGNPGLAVDDPDGLVLEARWFTRGEAVALLRRLPYRPLCEPVVAYLTDSVDPGSHWHFEGADADPVVTPAGAE
ncbi:MAG: NUDIX hydrolase [Nocardioides sp.]|uniref:NUDIX hydrolase n=1 Tax=Nocardioides sp. TaxID=35761 RepID=UPI0023A0A56C|nr:NUDIX hydrolase [Nocardioides sp.]MDE0777147.1 NUDIX hydrolase [Nocardioides sp.]